MDDEIKVTLEEFEVVDLSNHGKRLKVEGDVFFKKQTHQDTTHPIYRMRHKVTAKYVDSGPSYFYSISQSQLTCTTSLALSTSESLTQANRTRGLLSIDEARSQAGWDFTMEDVRNAPEEERDYYRALFLNGIYGLAYGHHIVIKDGLLGIESSSGCNALEVPAPLMEALGRGEVSFEFIARVLINMLLRSRFQHESRRNDERRAVRISKALSQSEMEEFGTYIGPDLNNFLLTCNDPHNLNSYIIRDRHQEERDLDLNRDRLASRVRGIMEGTDRLDVGCLPADKYAMTRGGATLLSISGARPHRPFETAHWGRGISREYDKFKDNPRIDPQLAENMLWYLDFLIEHKKEVVNGAKVAKSAGAVREQFNETYANDKGISHLVSPFSFILSEFG